MKKQLNREKFKEALADGWTNEQLKAGYDIAVSDYMGGAKHIEKIDVIDLFDSDKDAAEYAEEHDKVKIIKDLPDFINKESDDFGYFIDTPENVRVIKNYIKEKYGYDWVRKVKAVDKTKLTKYFENLINKENRGKILTLTSALRNATKYCVVSDNRTNILLNNSNYVLNSAEFVNGITQLEEEVDIEKISDNFITFLEPNNKVWSQISR